MLVTVKSIHTDDAAATIARHAPQDAVVISFQNGVSNADRLRAALPGRTILAGMVPFNVVRLGNGRWHKATAGDLMAEEHQWSEKRKAFEWTDAVQYLGTMGLQPHKLSLTRADVENGQVGGYDDEGLYARHGK